MYESSIQLKRIMADLKSSLNFLLAPCPVCYVGIGSHCNDLYDGALCHIGRIAQIPLKFDVVYPLCEFAIAADSDLGLMIEQNEQLRVQNAHLQTKLEEAEIFISVMTFEEDDPDA